jgi:hypothetical protein
VIALDDYHRMIDAGVFAEDEHVEMIEGVIVRAGDTLALPALGLQLALGDIFPAH